MAWPWSCPKDPLRALDRGQTAGGRVEIEARAAGDLAPIVGDLREQGRGPLRRIGVVLALPQENPRVIAQRRTEAVRSRAPADRWRPVCREPACQRQRASAPARCVCSRLHLGRSALSGVTRYGRAGGLAEKGPGLPQRFLERDRTKPFLQQVYQIAILPRREIGPRSGFAPTLSLQPDGEALTLWRPRCRQPANSCPACDPSGKYWRQKLSARSARSAERSAMLRRAFMRRHSQRLRQPDARRVLAPARRCHPPG